jgi:serine/threonine protein kinase
MHCPVCKHVCQPHETACPTCGFLFQSQSAKKQQAATAPPQAPRHYAACAYCGQVLPAGAKFCVMCGKPTLIAFRPPQSGQKLAKGRYTIQRALSKGGMGAIYLATDHETFERTVVVKAMLDYFDPTKPQEVQAARDLFVQEARTLAELRHPAIPQIYTHFQEDPHNYIVMEYIEGRDLEQQLTRPDEQSGKIIRGSAYPQQEVIRWGIALCKVLEYLASRTPHPVVHHDIKPANLLLDGNSNEIRLVDFGTARARLLVQTGGGSVGLQKSSIYGTQGYAPPEQYRGESEPRSDVYGLAATLYHLATDDDPANHPFAFPRLKQMGAFGEVLSDALQRDVRQRPTALQLRHRLETLQAPARPLQAPDGTDISQEQELAHWCEQHWEEAGRWLYQSLPDLVEHLWFKPDTAQQLRDIVRSTRNRSEGLDAALALLDPKNFGNERPELLINQPRVDFGRLAKSENHEQVLTITNSGRRFVRLHVELPDWISSKRTTIVLPPQKSTSVTLTPDVRQKGMWGKQQDYVLLRDNTGRVARVEMHVIVSRWRTMWQRVGRALRQAHLVLLMLLLMVAGGFGGWFAGSAYGIAPFDLYMVAGLAANLGGVLAGMLVKTFQADLSRKEVIEGVRSFGTSAGILCWTLTSVFYRWNGDWGSLSLEIIVFLFLIMSILGALIGMWFGIVGGFVTLVVRWGLGLFRRTG